MNTVTNIPLQGKTMNFLFSLSTIGFLGTTLYGEIVSVSSRLCVYLRLYTV